MAVLTENSKDFLHSVELLQKMCMAEYECVENTSFSTLLKRDDRYHFT